MKKKFISLAICATMMLTLLPQAVFATEEEELPQITVAVDLGGNGNVEARDSRWHREDIVVVKDKAYTLYSDDGLRMVDGTYTKVATYYVYNDGSGKRTHQFDTYYYHWTGYYRNTKTSTIWYRSTDYTSVYETYVDRGPIVSLFSYLVH